MALPVQLAEHHHRAVIIMFIVGYVLHALAQIDAIARAKNDPENSRVNLIVNNWIPLVVRCFISLTFFEILAHNQASAVSAIQSRFNLAANSLILALVNLPIVPSIAGGWGFVMDTILSFIPTKWTKTFVVPPPPEPVSTASNQKVSPPLSTTP